MTTRSLNRFCGEVLPKLLSSCDGRWMIERATEVVASDRYNSFDRFRQTTATLTRHYEEAGARVEVEPIQTGGRPGSGRWIIREAQDVHSATVDVVSPVRQRVLDFAENPWHVVQWTSGTPRGGARCKLVIIDSEEELRGLPALSLNGKMVLTALAIRDLMDVFADKGAVGVIADTPVPNLPDAVAWTKFGWGSVPLAKAPCRLVGLMVSQNQGRRLRRLHRRHGGLTVHARVDVRSYVGSHDVVSGIVAGADDPQDEVWAIAHSGEPGAVDNASGVVTCLEIARALEKLIAAGIIRRPRRSIRLINAYECYGFFAYLENTQRLQTPLAGVCIDTLGSKPKVCGGRLEWHSTIPMSAGFVDWVGAAILRQTLRRSRSGYRLCLEPFMSTSDTLIGDPKYGFPCPWITNHHQSPNRAWDAYHSSADTVELLSAEGLRAGAAAMAAYLYFLADAGSGEAMQMATAETDRLARELKRRPRMTAGQVDYVRDAHDVSMSQLRRWLWGGDRARIAAHFDSCRQRLRGEADKAARGKRGDARRRGTASADGRLVPRRTAPLSPTTENTVAGVRDRLGQGLSPWALFWADGKRDLAAIARAIACEDSGLLSPRQGSARNPGSEADALDRVIAYFRAHEELGYVALNRLQEMATKAGLARQLKRLGLRRGMDVMVHSSLSRMGPVHGGADTVIAALLAVLGRGGTLMMPSFNHGAAKVYNPLATPTINGAIPDALWRRSDAVRSLHTTHAVAAVGARAEELCADHLEAGIWEQDSPIGKLIHSGGYLLTIGTSHTTSTAHHVAEMSVPSTCNDPFGNVYRHVAANGRVEETLGLAWRAGTCPVPESKMDEALDRRGLQRRGLLGQADCEFVGALDLWHVRRQQLRNECPRCRIRPGYVD